MPGVSARISSFDEGVVFAGLRNGTSPQSETVGLINLNSSERRYKNNKERTSILKSRE